MILFASAILFSGSAMFVSAVDQMKTTETLIVSSSTAVTGVNEYSFTLYIGDDLSGVSNPLKSLYFTISGVYTGVGTVGAMIDNDPLTSKTFTLSGVGLTPTPFEINYKVPTNKINPSTAGSYEYTLNLNSGVTMYGMSIKMLETHRYAPPACPDGWPSNQKVKTTESFVASSDAPVSTNQVYPFSLYIGDNLSGINPAIKSIYFIASGVYTSTAIGTVSFMINGNSATTKIFTLPNTSGVPTPFEISYKDPAGAIINPTSAGTYPYSLNFNPTDVVMYGLNIKMEETHRYKPAVCVGLPPVGELTSATLDTFVTTSALQGPAYNSVMWKGTEGTGKVRFQLATSDCTNGATNYPACNVGTWTFYGSSDNGSTCNTASWYDTQTSGPGGGPAVPIEISCATKQGQHNKRYFQYKVQICSADCFSSGGESPKISEVIVNWAP